MTTHKSQSFPVRLKYAFQGVAHALRGERSFRVQLAALALLCLALALLRAEPVWWGLLLASGATVLAAELFNTAIEQLADALHPNDSPAIRIVKDCAAAAVLLAVLGALAAAAAFVLHLLARHA